MLLSDLYDNNARVSLKIIEFCFRGEVHGQGIVKTALKKVLFCGELHVGNVSAKIILHYNCFLLCEPRCNDKLVTFGCFCMNSVDKVRSDCV